MNFQKLDWKTMMSRYENVEYDISKYHEILCPIDDRPDFLKRYISLPVMQRLGGVGLLCGTDWTALYKNRIYYSRLDHSIGVALIIWHFTHNKVQTLAGLFHDIATPVFSHVSDFRKGDALTQSITEEPTSLIIRNSPSLMELLRQDGILVESIEDYHIYPIADNEIPRLSADRLEYMFPSGMALDGSWKMEEIKLCYDNIVILQNEDGKDELGFKSLEIAEFYCEHFCSIGHILQLNENKLALHLLGQVMNLAVKEGLLAEEDFMTKSEKEIISIMDSMEDFSYESCEQKKLFSLYKTFRNMTEVLHTTKPMDIDKYFCVNLKVKQRYINPLVQSKNSFELPKRLSQVSEKSKKIIEDFLSYEDTPYGCVKLF